MARCRLTILSFANAIGTDEIVSANRWRLSRIDPSHSVSSMREMTFREITSRDIPAVFDVRITVRENAYTREGLYSEGITEPAVEDMLGTSHRGSLCEPNSKVVGFAMANRETGGVLGNCRSTRI